MGSRNRKSRGEGRTAYWIAKLRAGSLSDADRRRFEAWRAAHPANHAAVEDLLRVYRRGPGARRGAGTVTGSGAGAGTELRRGRGGKSRRRAAPRSRPPLRALLAVGLFAVVLAFYLTRGEVADYRTEPGDQGSFAMSDGSVVFMNSDTAIDVSEDAGRWLHLLRGEADIIVAEGSFPPLEVRVGEARLSVAMGRLLLRNDRHGVTLAVIDGKASLAPDGGRALATEIAAGEVVTLDRDGATVFSSERKIEDLAAWQEGAVVFDATPVDEALRQLSRYRRSRLVVLSGSLGERVVAGRYSLDDPEALMAQLLRDNNAERLEILGLVTLVY